LSKKYRERKQESKEEEMSDLRNETKMNCEGFLNELEGLAPGAGAGGSERELLVRMTESARTHAAECRECQKGLEEFAATREVLRQMKPGMPEPGPWFALRVMQVIAARENQIEEGRNNVWVSVRRLAPRLSAIAAVLLVVGGTWAMELRRSERHARQAEMNSSESLFEGSSGAPINDDIVASVNEEQHR
jgi:hypothetical protein